MNTLLTKQITDFEHEVARDQSWLTPQPPGQRAPWQPLLDKAVDFFNRLKESAAQWRSTAGDAAAPETAQWYHDMYRVIGRVLVEIRGALRSSPSAALYSAQRRQIDSIVAEIDQLTLITPAEMNRASDSVRNGRTRPFSDFVRELHGKNNA